MPDSRVLVVGTTRDYVDYLQQAIPERLIFLTDPLEYPDGPPEPAGEAFHLVLPLSGQGGVRDELERFLEDYGLEIGGVACFDCESLLLASRIARGRWPFPPPQAVINSRDKYRSKRLWAEGGVACPRTVMAYSEGQVISFMDAIEGPLVLKPAVLSGSELTFKCRDPVEALGAFRSILRGLQNKTGNPLSDRDGLLDKDAVLCEEYIEGTEFSADFIYRHGQLRIMRIARKHLLPGGPAGTALAYELPAPGLPLAPPALESSLRSAVEALELRHCMGMADFIFRGSTPIFIEITPRPGGDCLPQLIKRSCGLDVRVAHIDFSAGRPVGIPAAGEWEHLVGLRVHAAAAGRLNSIRVRTEGLHQEIIEEHWIRKPGHFIKLPPEDYGSWLLGHVIFRPVPGVDGADQVRAVREAIEINLA